MTAEKSRKFFDDMNSWAQSEGFPGLGYATQKDGVFGGPIANNHGPDGMQAIAAGMLRGLKDTKVPMLLALISYWPIGFVCAWAFAFLFNFGGIGVWFGFVLGLAAAAVLLNWRFFRMLGTLEAKAAARQVEE